MKLNVHRHTQDKRAFTLIEMLVVVAIIAILAGIVGFSVTKARKQAGLTKAKAEIESVTNAAVLYFQDNGQWPIDSRPSTNNWNTPLFNKKYIDVTSPVDFARNTPTSYLGETSEIDYQSWGLYSYMGNPSSPDFGKMCVSSAPWCTSTEWVSVFPKITPQTACWQSVDLYQVVSGYTALAYRKCIRNTCPGQYYCRDGGNCWDTAAHRDAGPVGGGGVGYIGKLYPAGESSPAMSAVCEDCSGTGNGPGKCGKKYWY